MIPHLVVAPDEEEDMTPGLPLTVVDQVTVVILIAEEVVITVTAMATETAPETMVLRCVMLVVMGVEEVMVDLLQEVVWIIHLLITMTDMVHLQIVMIEVPHHHPHQAMGIPLGEGVEVIMVAMVDVVGMVLPHHPITILLGDTEQIHTFVNFLVLVCVVYFILYVCGVHETCINLILGPGQGVLFTLW